MAEISQNPESGEKVDWSRRQFLVGIGGLTAAGIIGLFGRSAIAQAVTSLSGGTPISSGDVPVYAGDYFYLPNKMIWKVGMPVSVIFHNQSPNRWHEMMIGRGYDTTPSIYGDVITQFHEDFWDGVAVTVAEAKSVDNLATNKAKVTCNVNPHPWLITQPGNGNFSPTLQPGGMIRLEFIVPNKPGHWEYGCFVQGFRHYEAGMRGTLEIQA